MPKLSDLKDVNFVSIDKAEVEAEVFAIYYTITKRTEPLADGDPVRLFILFIVNLVIMLLNKLNETGRKNLLKSSNENFLDGLGALVGTTRIPASAARVVMQIKLSAERETETIVIEINFFLLRQLFKSRNQFSYNHQRALLIR